MSEAELDAALIAAHEAGDGVVLARLYGQAADLAEAEGRLGAAGFFLVQAYVFALDAGLASAAGFYGRLKDMGREE